MLTSQSRTTARERAPKRRTRLSHSLDGVWRNQHVRLVQVGNHEPLAPAVLLVELQQDLLDRRVAERASGSGSTAVGEQGGVDSKGAHQVTRTPVQRRVGQCGCSGEAQRERARPRVALTILTCASWSKRSVATSLTRGIRPLIRPNALSCLLPTARKSTCERVRRRRNPRCTDCRLDNLARL